jgi:hypothetical protein
VGPAPLCSAGQTTASSRRFYSTPRERCTGTLRAEGRADLLADDFTKLPFRARIVIQE